MDVRALVVFGGADAGTEMVSGMPALALDVLGKPVIERIVERLNKFGIASTTIVSEHAAVKAPPGAHWIVSETERLWRTAQETFVELSQTSADLIIIMRVGAYAELDYEDLVQFHLEQGGGLTAVVQPNSEMLGVYVVHPARTNDAAYLFRHGLKTSRIPRSFYEFGGYVNPLANAADLRRLTIDAFCGNAELEPDGVQVRPGVWASPTARIHKRARVLAPAFIGAHARVRAAAVVTRCSALEHHAHVDCGTVVDNATLLPNTFVGAGLDVAHAVVGFRHFAHLGRNVEVEIADPKLVSTVSTAPVRFLGQVASLAGFLPIQFVRGLVRHRGAEPASLPDAVQAPSPALKNAEDQFPTNLAVVRRYGDE